MDVVFRVDASLTIGSGHVMRCLTLAEKLREGGAHCSFICRNFSGNLQQRIRDHYFEVYLLPHIAVEARKANLSLSHATWLGCDWTIDVEQTITILEEIRPQWLIVDHYAIDENWEQAAKKYCKKLMVIDDIADRKHAGDILLDQNLIKDMETRYQRLVDIDCQLLLGPFYALLQPIFAVMRQELPEREGVIKRILVYFGGADRHNLTGRTLSVLAMADFRDLATDVVIAGNSPHADSIRHQVAMNENFSLHQDVPNLAPLMLSADLTIGASGATSWERCCLGLPSMVFSIAANQTSIAKGVGAIGAGDYLGELEEDFTIEKRVKSSLRSFMSDTEKVREMSRVALNVTDGYGSERVVEMMKQKT